MRRLLEVRIVRWPGKLAYVVGVIAAGWVLGSLLRALGAPGVVTLAIGQVLDLAAILYAARVFRGRGEPVAPPRAWWQMTAWAPAAWTIGLVALYGAITSLVVLFVPNPEFAPYTATPDLVASAAITTGWLALVAAMYLHSAGRSRRAPAREQPPRFRPMVR
ncbi:hypothetical protein ACGGZK_17525 [Agromyces sp. MMS24-K17]|uniref:hypothetical protein n=1 Tax=Agromyces sp. MMS24-K17 TaxID=3372850 RepID=UPI0037547277